MAHDAPERGARAALGPGARQESSNGVTATPERPAPPNRAASRAAAYVVLGAALAAAALLAQAAQGWRSSAELHTLLEALATATALGAGVMALARHVSRGHPAFLLIGAGLVGAAALDGYHTAVTSSWLREQLPSSLPSLVPWSWLAPRLFLSAAVLVACTLAAPGTFGAPEAGEPQGPRARTVLGWTALAATGCALVFALVPLPDAYHPDLWIPRAQEVLPAALFLAALAVCLARRPWRTDPFEHWLVLALIFSVASQAAFMPFSSRLFDAPFDAAHLSKLAGYGCVFVGLLVSMSGAFSAVEREVAARIRLEQTVAAREAERLFQAERVRAAEHLQAAHELRERIVAELPLGTSIYDQRGQCLDANAAMAALIGATREQVLAQNFHRIDSWRESGLHDAALRALASGERQRLDLAITTSFGKDVCLDSQLVPLEVGGEQRLLLTVDDVSERVAAQAALARHQHELEGLVAERTAELKLAHETLLRRSRLATLGQLTATVSHELRNPLGAMRMALYVLKTRSLEGDALGLRAVGRLERSIDRCDRIVDELLDFTRTGDLDLAPIELDAWLHGVLDELAAPAGVEIRRELGLTGLEVMVDADRLRRAVINVYDNACQAMLGEEPGSPPAGATLTAATRRAGERIELVFTDTGPGVPAELAERIFEPLFSTKGFGVGLGLPTVRQVLTQHGGEVELGPGEGGRGARVVLWLPGAAVVEAASAGVGSGTPPSDGA